MQEIGIERVRGWKKDPQIGIYPVGVSTQCPSCGMRAIFTLDTLTLDGHRHSLAQTGRCPECSTRVHFLAIHESSTARTTDEKPRVFMHPSRVTNYVAEEAATDVPEKLMRSYISTVDSYNSQNYPATAVGARRTLEGIFKYLVPEEDRTKSLFHLIQQVTQQSTLAAPLTTLSHAIRDGGNLGAHFDPDAEPTEQMAKQMVELLSYLIKFLYVLPKEIEKLESSMGKGAPLSPDAA